MSVAHTRFGSLPRLMSVPTVHRGVLPRRVGVLAGACCVGARLRLRRGQARQRQPDRRQAGVRRQVRRLPHARARQHKGHRGPEPRRRVPRQPRRRAAAQRRAHGRRRPGRKPESIRCHAERTRQGRHARRHSRLYRRSGRPARRRTAGCSRPRCRRPAPASRPSRRAASSKSPPTRAVSSRTSPTRRPPPPALSRSRCPTHPACRTTSPWKPAHTEPPGSGSTLAASKFVTKGSASISVTLKPGTYTFFCQAPGHRAAGMYGTLTVK